MTTMLIDQIRHIEILAMDAWPAQEVSLLDGWRLRATEGVTRRANSVWPNASEDVLSLADKVAAAEAFYRRRNLPSRFQICPAALPADLDAVLARRNYARVAPTHVQTVSLDALLALTAAPMASGRSVAISAAMTEGWFSAYRQAEQIDDRSAQARRAILNRIQTTAGFALLTEAAADIALGLGVLQGDCLGIFHMAVAPARRRRGAATAVLQALGAWAAQHGARRAYLQVMQNNGPALALYTRAGFTTLYDYHYRELRT